MQVEVVVKCMQTNFVGHGVSSRFGFLQIWPIFPFEIFIIFVINFISANGYVIILFYLLNVAMKAIKVFIKDLSQI